VSPISWRGEKERCPPLTTSGEDAELNIELVSVHFPKAAGTTLANLLRSVYGESLHLDYGHPPHDPREREPIERYPNVRAVHGHFHADRYHEFPNARRICFLREPVDNLISIYFFWKAMPPSGYEAHERLLREQPGIVEFSTYPEVRRLASQSYFGGVDMAAFDLVGFYEDRERGLQRLSQILGVELDVTLHLNRRHCRSDAERLEMVEDAATMETVRGNLRDDIAFYNAARSRWG